MYRWMLLLLLTCPIAASAQMVRGTVTDATTGIPIKAANLSLYTTAGQRLLRGTSDEDGKFEMVLPKGKTVYLQAERIGYETIKSAPITASTSELLQLNVRLSAMAVPLQGIEVVTRRQVDPRLQEFMDRASLYKRAGLGHIWTRKELEQRHPALASHILNWVPERQAINCLGLSVFIDGLPVDTQDVRSDIDLLVAPDQLEGVEMYNDMDVPPDLLMKAVSFSRGTADVVPPCRTIMFWRKPYGELHPEFGPQRAVVWRALLGATLLGGLLFLEHALFGSH